MPNTYTTRLGLPKPTQSTPSWDVPIRAALDVLDNCAAVGAFAIRAKNIDSTTGVPGDRIFTVAGGTYLSNSGGKDFVRAQLPIEVASSGDFTAAVSSTTYVWFDEQGGIGTSTTGWDTDEAHFRIGRVTTNANRIVSITDDRAPAILYAGGRHDYIQIAFDAYSPGGSSTGPAGAGFLTIALADASAGPVTITLPSASGAIVKGLYTVKKIDGTANAVTVQRAGSDTIDGGTSLTISAAYGVTRLVCGAAGKWWTI